MSSDAEPITPARFAAALPALPLSTLRLKILELRSSISHLLYSNAELKPFADADPPDEVCAEAIRENEVVLERMLERISLLKDEVEKRGARWDEFEAGAAPETSDGQEGGEPAPEGEGSHPAWSDGTFQTGTIRLEPSDAQGGSLSDAELARQLEERMRTLDEEDTTENGVHL